MLDPRQLQALTAVAAEGSVARAAVRLGWSQPTVDYHLKALDALVNAPLTDRDARGTRLTPAGSLMLERGTEILAMADRALTDVREFASVGRTRLRFGSFPTGAARLLPGITRRLEEVGIEIDAVLEEISPLVTRVNTGTLDAALVYAAVGYTLPFRDSVHTTHLLTDPLLLALPEQHPAAMHETLGLPELLSLEHMPWAFGATAGDTLDDAITEVFHEAGQPLEVAIRTDDYSVVLGMVAAGLCVALVPQLATQHVPRGAALRSIDDPRFARKILLAAPAPNRAPHSRTNTASRAPAGAELPPAVRQLAEAVRRAIAALET